MPQSQPFKLPAPSSSIYNLVSYKLHFLHTTFTLQPPFILHNLRPPHSLYNRVFKNFRNKISSTHDASAIGLVWKDPYKITIFPLYNVHSGHTKNGRTQLWEHNAAHNCERTITFNSRFTWPKSNKSNLLISSVESVFIGFCTYKHICTYPLKGK